eukprot:6149193-Prymnesium_polylepis.1
MSAQRMPAAMVIVFGSMVSKKVQLLQHAGSIRSFGGVLFWGIDEAARAVSRRCGRAGAVWRARASGRCACG